MRAPSIMAGMVWLSCSAFSQTTGTPEFEVASVRVNQSGDTSSFSDSRSGQVAFRGFTMKMLIGVAWKETHAFPELTALKVSLLGLSALFNVYGEQYLKGGPPWLDSDRFDVIAKAPEGTSNNTMRLMLQKLLQDRFHLVVHGETRTLKVYSLTVGKGGHKLTPSDGTGEAACAASIGKDNSYHRDCHNMTMGEFAEQLASYAPRFFEGRPVVDATGLKGAWDFKLDWVPLDGGAAGLNAPAGTEFNSGRTIFGATDKELGLKLDLREQPMPIIMIDQVSRVPTEN